MREVSHAGCHGFQHWLSNVGLAPANHGAFECFMTASWCFRRRGFGPCRGIRGSARSLRRLSAGGKIAALWRLGEDGLVRRWGFGRFERGKLGVCTGMFLRCVTGGPDQAAGLCSPLESICSSPFYQNVAKAQWIQGQIDCGADRRRYDCGRRKRGAPCWGCGGSAGSWQFCHRSLTSRSRNRRSGEGFDPSGARSC